MGRESRVERKDLAKVSSVMVRRSGGGGLEAGGVGWEVFC